MGVLQKVQPSSPTHNYFHNWCCELKAFKGLPLFSKCMTLIVQSKQNPRSHVGKKVQEMTKVWVL
jgi:hypothetical protein